MNVLCYEEIKEMSPTAVTIGNFDGVHIGHRFLLEKVKDAAARMGLKTAVLTFSPHPRRFFGANLPLITTNDEKELIFDSLCIELKAFAEFNDSLSSLSPLEFVDKILVNALNCKYVAVGENFSFGKGKAGSARALTSLCGERGITAEFFPRVTEGGAAVSSERIRAVIAKGDICHANTLLGGTYFIKAAVDSVSDFAVYSRADMLKLLPENGIFTTELVIDGESREGITYIGTGTVEEEGYTCIKTVLSDCADITCKKPAVIRFLRQISGMEANVRDEK